MKAYLDKISIGEDMKIYLAGPEALQGYASRQETIGGISQELKIYLAQSGSLFKIIQNETKGKDMKVYLADNSSLKSRIGNPTPSLLDGANILQSFYYADEWTEKTVPRFGSFLLDSGTFTFLNALKQKKGNLSSIDWDGYLDRYASFIVKNDIKLFFELDIDAFVGYRKVLELRKRLEDKTQRPCIPVWHKSRGIEEFYKMCEHYNYVAIGGIVNKEIKRKEHRYFSKFIDIAHKNGAKIHGLGFTTLSELPYYHFDSVDSTSWVSGNKYGIMYKFNGKTMVRQVKKEGQRLTRINEAAIVNFTEWRKFCDYAETHL